MKWQSVKRSEEHTSELQSLAYLVCRLLLEKKNALESGDFLEGFNLTGASAFEDWLTAERSHCRARSVDVLVRHADGLLLLCHATAAAYVSPLSLHDALPI